MAKVLYGEGVMAISGTIGGTTHQKWRSIDVIRKKPTPHNPQTPRQTRIRAIVSTVSRAWRDVLNQGQRIAWEQHAEQFPWFDVFGKALMLRGINLFLKVNTVLLDHNKPMRIVPPPAVVPPELTDVVVTDEPAELFLQIPQLVAGIVTAQEPFVDVWIAGGFTSIVEAGSPEIYEVTVQSTCLPAGRTAQKSDYRHGVYLDDTPILVTPDVNSLFVLPPGDTTKNVSVRLQRYNQFGNYSVPVVFSGVRTN